MDNHIEKLEELTQQIVSKLEHISYEEISGFVDRRQILIDNILVCVSRNSVSHSQRERLETLLHLDSVIMERMIKLKDEAGEWLLQRGQAKAQRNVYEAAYSPDSILMDRRN